jgi:hypothetical protein
MPCRGFVGKLLGRRPFVLFERHNSLIWPPSRYRGRLTDENRHHRLDKYKILLTRSWAIDKV